MPEVGKLIYIFNVIIPSLLLSNATFKIGYLIPNIMNTIIFPQILDFEREMKPKSWENASKTLTGGSQFTTEATILV